MCISEIMTNAGFDKPVKNWALNAVNDAIDNGIIIEMIQKGSYKESNGKKWNVRIVFNQMTFKDFIPTKNRSSSSILNDVAMYIFAIAKKYKNLIKTNVHTCERCGGKGYIKQFSHYADGVCFKCLGTGKVLSCGN